MELEKDRIFASMVVSSFMCMVATYTVEFYWFCAMISLLFIVRQIGNWTVPEYSKLSWHSNDKKINYKILISVMVLVLGKYMFTFDSGRFGTIFALTFLCYVLYRAFKLGGTWIATMCVVSSHISIMTFLKYIQEIGKNMPSDMVMIETISIVFGFFLLTYIFISMTITSIEARSVFERWIGMTIISAFVLYSIIVKTDVIHYRDNLSNILIFSLIGFIITNRKLL